VSEQLHPGQIGDLADGEAGDDGCGARQPRYFPEPKLIICHWPGGAVGIPNGNSGAINCTRIRVRAAARRASRPCDGKEHPIVETADGAFPNVIGNQAAQSPRLPWPACARLIAATERSIADHSRAISVVQLGSLPISPALMPAASEPRKVVRWLIWPENLVALVLLEDCFLGRDLLSAILIN
jgi:hypothetical protein